MRNGILSLTFSIAELSALLVMSNSDDFLYIVSSKIKKRMRPPRNQGSVAPLSALADTDPAWLEALAKDPNAPAGFLQLATSLEQAEQNLEEYSLLSPTFNSATYPGKVLFERALEYVELGDQEKALDLFSGALELDPALGYQVSLQQMKIYMAQQKLDLAVKAADQILTQNPNHLDALQAKCICLHYLGDPSEGVATVRRMLKLAPDAELHRKLLFSLLYLSETTPESLYEECCRWYALYGAPLARKRWSHSNVPDPNRLLKVGYVSPDFRVHAMMKLLPAVFEHHDPGPGGCVLLFRWNQDGRSDRRRRP